MGNITYEAYKQLLDVKHKGDWVDFMSQNENWDDTKCVHGTQTYNGKNDFYGNEWCGYESLEKIEHITTEKSMEIETIDTSYDPEIFESTWDVETIFFVYEGYAYTVTLQSIHDAQTFTGFSMTRRPLKHSYK
tara:strand:+ start:128 stop:526 length:399 start_codon:yes stop_codon:yes gene_type:complete